MEHCVMATKHGKSQVKTTNVDTTISQLLYMDTEKLGQL